MRFLFVDRIIELSPGEFVRGLKHITRDDFYLGTGPQGRTCFISSLIGETLGQLAAWSVMAKNNFSLRPVAGVVASAKPHRPAYLGETLLLEAWIDNLDDQAVLYHGQAKIGDEPVFTLEGALGPLLPMEQFIDEALVRRQFAEINRPGEWSQISGACQNQQPIPFAQSSEPKLLSFEFDRILSLNEGEGLMAEKRISIASPYFPDHFPNKPVLPMTVLLEAKLNLATTYLKACGLVDKYQVSELRRVKMNGFVQPGDILQTALRVKSQSDSELVLAFKSEVAGQRVCVMELVLTGRG